MWGKLPAFVNLYTFLTNFWCEIFRSIIDNSLSIKDTEVINTFLKSSKVAGVNDNAQSLMQDD